MDTRISAESAAAAEAQERDDEMEEAYREGVKQGRADATEAAIRFVESYADDCFSTDCCEVYAARQAKAIAEYMRKRLSQ